MSELIGLQSVLLLALVFNIVAFGIFDFVNAQELDSVSCPIQSASFDNLNATTLEPEGAGVFVSRCEPPGLPFWYYWIWGIINLVFVYAFIPFVK